MKLHHDQELLDLLLEITVLLNDDMDRDLAARGLTRARAHLLWVIASGAANQRELADRLGVSARNVTGLVDGLVDTGFAERRPHPTDRRATSVVLTAKGTAAAEHLQRDGATLAGELFGGLPERRAAALRRELTAIRERLQLLLTGS